MNSVIISVILPFVSDCGKLDRFCKSLFSSRLETELIICEDDKIKQGLSVNEEYSDKIHFIKTDNNIDAVAYAVKKAQGSFIVFSDVNTVYAPGAFEKMLVAGKGSACVANTAFLNDGEASGLYPENYLFEDTAVFPVYSGFLMQNDIIRKAQIIPTDRDCLSIMLFIASYSRYESFTALNDVLLYIDYKPSYGDIKSDKINEYAEDFAINAPCHSKLFYLTAAVSALTDGVNEQKRELLKNISEKFCDDYAVVSWARARFSLDLYSLSAGDSLTDELLKNPEDFWYKEVKAPLNEEDVVKNFCYGKLGAGVLKRCIGAWLYYKFYRRKDGFIKRTGCRICRKLLGGDIGV